MDLLAETSALSQALDRLPPPRGVAAVLNPLRYAWAPHRRWLQRFTVGRPSSDSTSSSEGWQARRRRVLIVGMNPGPHGMMQTGVPFGDVVSARKVLGLAEDYALKPGNDPDLLIEPQTNLTALTPAARGKLVRTVNGFAHKTVEESGRRLWGLLEDMWGGLDALLADVFVMNMVPLAYFSEAGENLTPPDLDREDRERVLKPCLAYFRSVVRAMRPEVIVGVGRWSQNQCLAESTVPRVDGQNTDLLVESPRVIYLPHPSPRGGTFSGWVKDAAQVLAPYAPGAT